jgi:oligoribonuclease
MIPLIWIDLETTGLDESQGLVLEIAARMTDQNLVETSRFHTVIHYPADAHALTHLNSMVLEMHTHNGLLDEVATSTVTLEDARKQFASWLFNQYTLGEKRPLAGSNPEFDRRWLNVHFEDASAFLHYRSFDMNTVYYYLEIDKDQKKQNIHRASYDIGYDIGQLQKFKGKIK